MNQGQDSQRTELEVQFDRSDRRYEPGDGLAVHYRILAPGEEQIRALEHSIVWYTEGKGEEDLGVHFFERLADRKSLAAVRSGQSFTTQLPPSPLSYEGLIVKIRWCVRVRIFFPGGRDFVSEHVFDLGSIPPAWQPQEVAS